MNLISGTAYSNRYLYTGREYDQNLGIYYYRARFYSPETGRFLTPDPKMFIDGRNIYGYCRNNPVNRKDPLGLDDHAGDPFEGGLDNDSLYDIWVIDMDNDRVENVPANGQSSEGTDWDFALLPDGNWWKIGGGELDIGENGLPKWGQIDYRKAKENEIADIKQRLENLRKKGKY